MLIFKQPVLQGTTTEHYFQQPSIPEAKLLCRLPSFSLNHGGQSKESGTLGAALANEASHTPSVFPSVNVSATEISN